MEVISLHEPKSSADFAGGDTVLQTKVHALLSIDMDNFMPTCKSLVLVSGSAKLVDTVADMQEKGSDVEVIFFEEACSRELQMKADRFRGLSTEGLQLRMPEKVYT